MEEIEDIIASAEDDAADLPDDEDSGEDSWTTGNGTSAVKKTDRHVFLYRETVLPEKVQAFFLVRDLQPGKKRKIVLWQNNHRFDAFIEKTLHDPPLTRLRWNQEFASLVRNTCPELYDFFKKQRGESGDTPALTFSKRREPDAYDVMLEGAPAGLPEADTGLPVRPGEVIDNTTLVSIFRCSSQGAMRRSPATNSIILVADHTKAACDDRWIGKTFHFTGLGLTGDQGLSFNQNKALCESDEKGTRLFFFEIFREGDYTFIGEAGLADNPYLSRQSGPEKAVRDVTVFPLILKGNAHPPLPAKKVPAAPEEPLQKTVQELPPEQPGFAVRDSRTESGRGAMAAEVYDGDRIVAEYAKRRAGGICELCNRPAPFKNPGGEPYLEIHHIIPLAEGGQDSIGNVAALCPNCHRKMHVLNLTADEVRLKNRAASRE